METDWLYFDNSSSLCDQVVEQGQRSLAVKARNRSFRINMASAVFSLKTDPCLPLEARPEIIQNEP